MGGRRGGRVKERVGGGGRRGKEGRRESKGWTGEAGLKVERDRQMKDERMQWRKELYVGRGVGEDERGQGGREDRRAEEMSGGQRVREER